jgi:Cu(I)/Ag(I) efflux system membrane fusion protein
MVKAAKTVGAAADIKAAREAFGPLSDAVVAAAKAEGYKDLADVKLAYCPMVQKSWLQKGDQIQNPYYGQAMSSCGEFKKK